MTHSEMTEEQREILKDCVTVLGIMEDDAYRAMQLLRDTFPDGVPVDAALRFVKEVNDGKPFLEISALNCLAMVPVPGIKDELVQRLSALKAEDLQTDETYNLRFDLSKSLRFLGAPEGDVEFAFLKALVHTYPLYEGPVPRSWFDDIETELADWRKMLAEGTRWEPEW